MEIKLAKGILRVAGNIDVVALRTAIECFGHNTLAMLKTPRRRILAQLLTRLDLAIGRAFTEDIFTDEINTPLRNSHRR
jgi:hypothetical protein